MTNIHAIENATRKGQTFIEVLGNRNFSLALNKFQIDDGGGKPFPLKELEKQRVVDFYATIPGSDKGNLFDLLRGTMIDMKTFYNEMSKKNGTVTGNAALLKSDHFGNIKDLAFSYNNHFFTCNVFHGSSISQAQKNK